MAAWPGNIFLGSNTEPTPGATKILGKAPQNFLGHTVASGDVDGDGLTDVIIDTRTDNVYTIYGVSEWPELIELETYTGLTKITNYGSDSVYRSSS